MKFLPRLSSMPLIVVILFAADLLFILLHLGQLVAPAFARVEFDLTRDHSLGEAFGYLKLYWIALLLLWMAFRRGRRSALPWALLFGYLMLDDLLRLHETGGAALVALVGLEPTRPVFAGLPAQDAGELAVSGSVALLALVTLMACYRRASVAVRQSYLYLFLLSGALAACGMLVDAASAVFPRGGFVLHLFEDGGELLVISGILAYVWRQATQARRPSPDEGIISFV